MVNKNQVRCHACGRVITIRVTVSGGLQEFIFPCPYCGAQLTGTFFAEQPTEPLTPENPPKPFELRSEDFDVLDYDRALETEEMRVVAISTELPVHRSMLAEPYEASNFSPFLKLVRLLGQSDGAIEVVEKVNLLRQMRFELLPPVRRAAVFYGGGDIGLLSRELQRIPGFPGSPLAEEDPWRAITAILQGFLRALGTGDMREAAVEELRALLEGSFEKDGQATEKLLADLNARALQEHRRGLLDTLVRSLAVSDALVPGMWVEALPDLEIDQYRIQRADYDEVKTRYQEIFELGSRSLVLPASLSNLLQRGDPREYKDGGRRSLREALSVKAEVREGWLEELPAAKAFYDDTARATRNLIGHRLVAYDFEDAVLVDSKGRRYNYLSFLRDYLGAVRSCAYCLDIVEFLTDIEQLEARASSGGSGS